MARKRKGDRVDGWLIVDKPEGVTSTQVVGRARWAFNAQKAGHAGTLDPLATGLVAVAFGEATKTVPYAQDGLKTYRFTARWGELSATDDREGEIVETSNHRPSAAAIEAALPDFTGEIMQTPPVYSAIKVDGARAYDLARKGEDVALAARPIWIEALRLLSLDDEDHATFEMVCGKGGYVRSMARDLGAALGTVARVQRLRRLSSGGFDLSSAIAYDDIEALRGDEARFAHLAPIERGLHGLPRLEVSSRDASRVAAGDLSAVPAFDDGDFWVSDQDRPVAILARENGAPRIRRVFNFAED
ncbi:MAG: tRNA pseudouridine(55) synthase TruB [Pseudomonadota bacterium]